jgi:hypothetical protein
MAFSATWHRKLGLLSPLLDERIMSEPRHLDGRFLQLNAFVDTIVQSVRDYINRRMIFHVEFPLEKETPCA